MSLDSNGAAAAAAPLQYEVWNELRVKAQPESWLPPYPLHNTNYYFKFVHDTATSSFCLIITDLCFVWLQRVEQKTIDSEMKRFNSSIRKKTTNHTITMLSELLRENNSQQFHLVRLQAPEDAEEHEEERKKPNASARSGRKAQAASAASSSAAASTSNAFTPTLHLESSMFLGGLITFKWHFTLHSYGGPLEQCAFLRSQMYLPMHEMLKMLSWQLVQERRKNEKLMSGGAGVAAASGGGGRRGVTAAPAAGDMSLSCDLPSLSTAEREAQARVALAPTGAAGAATTFDAYSSAFSFGQIGSVYISALNRLSGDDGASFDNPSQATPMSYDPHAAPSQPPPSPGLDSKMAPSVPGKRGMKRDRSPSPAAEPRHSAAAAAASSSAYRHDSTVGGAHHGRGDPDMDYKHAEDNDPSPSFPQPSYHASAEYGGGASNSLLQGSLQSSLDIGGAIDDDGVYRESEAERMRREMLTRQLSQQKKKKKKKAFV